MGFMSTSSLLILQPVQNQYTCTTHTCLLQLQDALFMCTTVYPLHLELHNACSRVHVGLVLYIAGGFQDLPHELQLCEGHQKLPTSHTCAFQLNIPQCTGLDEVKAAFDIALTQSEGFGFA